MLSAAQMLDELMGRDRNLAPTDKRREVHWEDSDVCKYFLCGFCPHELFVNTRADLGPCDKLHDEKLKASYEKSSRYERVGYEEEFLRFLQSLLSDVERRIRKGQARLCLNNTQGGMASGPQVAREEKISLLTEKINDLVQKAEELGCEGKVEDAQGMMKLCEQLTEERTQLETSRTFSMPPVKEMEVCEVCAAFLVKGDAHNRLSEHLIGKQHMGYAQLRATIDSLQMQTVVRTRDLEHSKDMQVCEICGALLVVGDAQQRVDEHLLGKQHMGYAQIRSYVETRKEKTRKKLRGDDEEREAKLAKEREDREKEREDREKEREERRKKRELDDKERAERKKQRKSRSRSKSRSKRRSRSRSNSRRHKRSRSRDRRRSRSRDRERRHHSRSRSRSRRSKRSRSRRSSRDRDSKRMSRDKDRDRSSRDKDGKEEKDRSSRDKEGSSRDKDKERSSRDKERDKDRSSRDRDRDRERSSRDGDRDRSRRECDSSRDRDRDRSSRKRDDTSKLKEEDAKDFKHEKKEEEEEATSAGRNGNQSPSGNREHSEGAALKHEEED